ncbi:MAG: hypothetical protein IPG39_11885 [Bacteroidetes bacterium]|nr:hypothetical protein [Bacteroidota bacterium]
MKKITDHFRIPRELLAYIVNTTAAPLSVIVPISTWTLFIGSILVKSQFGGEETANHAYWQVIPYVAYSWVSIFMIPLVIVGVVPLFGKMKKANARAINFGQIIPPGKKIAAVKLELFENEKQPKTIYFILPLIVLLVSTVLLDYDALKGSNDSSGIYICLLYGNEIRFLSTTFRNAVCRIQQHVICFGTGGDELCIEGCR